VTPAEPLSRLCEGESARIVHVSSEDPYRLVRLSSLGVAPGALVQLQQRSPALVLRIGETTLAVEPRIGDEIFVRRLTF